jgi:ABC-type uncharacterized transport system substrate-binding protein
MSLLLLVPTVFAKKILVIESYHQGFAWDDAYVEGIKSKLAGHEVIRFSMDTKRIKKEMFAKAADDAWKKYQELKPDAVVLGDDNALKLLGKRFYGVKTPVIFLGINANPKSYDAVGKENVTGILERPLYDSSVFALKKVTKAANGDKIAIVFDNGATSKISVESIKKKKKIGGLNIDVFNFEKFKDYNDFFKNAKKNGYKFVLIGLYHSVVDEAGKSVASNDAIIEFTKNSEVPVFGFWDFSVGKDKAAGGLCLDGKVQGEMAGNLIKSIFGGKKAGSIQFLTGRKGSLVFSKARLDHWKITLPADIKKKAKMID